MRCCYNGVVIRFFVHCKDLASRRSYLSPGSYCGANGSVVSGPISASQRRGRFIVLGSSGECLPVSRRLLPNDTSSVYSSCDSESEEYHSARASFDMGNMTTTTRFFCCLLRKKKFLPFRQWRWRSLCKKILKRTEHTGKAKHICAKASGSSKTIGQLYGQYR